MQQLKPKQKEEYKETGLGYLPENWKVVGFENAILKKRIKIGKIKQQEYKEIGKYPVIDQSQNYIAGHTDEKDKLYQAFLPVIIFGDHTRIFKFVDFPFVAGADGIKVILPDNRKFDSKFFYYGMLELKIASRGYNRHYPLLREKKIPLPPLPEQKKIAAVLSAVQETKKKIEAVIKATRELKKSLMKHLFTYGPVPVEEAENVPFRETEIGLIPKDWRVVRLGDIVNSQYGYTASAEEKNIGPKFLRITDIDDTGNVSWPTVPYCSISSEGYHKFILRDDDILVARIGATTGKACVIKNPPECVFASYLIRLTIDDKLVAYPDFVYDFTKSVFYWIQVNANKEGKLKKGISATLLKNLRVPLPSLLIQQKIAKILSTVDEKIETEENKKKALEELFKTLLNNLMTAEIRVDHLRIAV